MSTQNKKGLTLFELCLFPILGAMMFLSKLLMEALPNIHLLGMFTMVFAIVFRLKGLIPLYIYIFINGVYAGFNIWWIPYLYIWTILFFVALIIPKNIPDKIAAFVYPAVCALHGICFGILYAPAQALFMGFSFKQTLAWIAAGLTFDVFHFFGNLLAGLLVLPLSKLLNTLVAKAQKSR